ncbi:hypothetical protein F0562_001356 [Nyssa sinensis]|uniref:Uncharacterized protein n=1 Tax=Nyssa sinensis TaxID=561372 RepID=A0A5J5C3T5_9ASTE|nr:hypothetical protein F0562_001356 [Nyssa sinensis]
MTMGIRFGLEDDSFGEEDDDVAKEANMVDDIERADWSGNIELNGETEISERVSCTPKVEIVKRCLENFSSIEDEEFEDPNKTQLKSNNGSDKGFDSSPPNGPISISSEIAEIRQGINIEVFWVQFLRVLHEQEAGCVPLFMDLCLDLHRCKFYGGGTKRENASDRFW